MTDLTHLPPLRSAPATLDPTRPGYYLELAYTLAKVRQMEFATVPAPMRAPLCDAHVTAYESAECCNHCGELFAPEQMKFGECEPCWHEGLARDLGEERNYRAMTRRML